MVRLLLHSSSSSSSSLLLLVPVNRFEWHTTHCSLCCYLYSWWRWPRKFGKKHSLPETFDCRRVSFEPLSLEYCTQCNRLSVAWVKEEEEEKGESTWTWMRKWRPRETHLYSQSNWRTDTKWKNRQRREEERGKAVLGERMRVKNGPANREKERKRIINVLSVISMNRKKNLSSYIVSESGRMQL